MENSSTKYPCPVCGHLVFIGPAGSYDICPICYWEDDMVQLKHPDMSGGANNVSLIEAQQNFIKLGVAEEKFKDNVRAPNQEDQKDPKWRIFDTAKDPLPQLDISNEDLEENLQAYYYWLK